MLSALVSKGTGELEAESMMQLWPWFSFVRKADTCEGFYFSFRECVSPILKKISLGLHRLCEKTDEATEIDWL